MNWAPRHHCSPKTDCMPGARIQTGEVWLREEELKTQPGLRLEPGGGESRLEASRTLLQI